MKLIYFPIAGRAFPIRAALRYGNIPFEDVRVGHAEFLEMRGPEGASEKVPLGQLPVLVLDNGYHICQSQAILKYAGKLSKLYPEDPVQALLVDEVIESMSELYNGAPSHENMEEKLKLRKAWFEAKVLKYFKALDRMAARNGGPHLLGKDYSIADLVLFRLVTSFATGQVDGVDGAFVKNYPKLTAVVDAAGKHPIAAAETALQAKLDEARKAKQ